MATCENGLWIFRVPTGSKAEIEIMSELLKEHENKLREVLKLLSAQKVESEHDHIFDFIMPNGQEFVFYNSWDAKGKIRCSLKNRRDLFYKANPKANFSPTRSAKAIANDLLNRVITEGIEIYNQAKREAHERKAQEQLKSAELESLLNENGTTIEKAKSHSGFYGNGIKLSEYGVQDHSGKYRAEINCNSEHAFRMILRILKEDSKFLNPA